MTVVGGQIARSARAVSVRLLAAASEADLREEMARVGCDAQGIALMVPDAHTVVLRIESISAPAANILKQEMLAAGGDAAVHRDTITAKAPRGPAVVFGTPRVLLAVAKKLAAQPFGLPAVGLAMRRVLQTAAPAPLVLRGRTFPEDKTLVMGVLNVTPDSFSDGGRWLDPKAALAHAERLLEEGADLIDVGGMSTRPGSAAADEAEELRRVAPVLDGLERLGAAVSIDTFRPRVAAHALARGAVLVNDVTGLRHGLDLAAAAAGAGAGICVMHMRGTPATMQADLVYEDLLGEVIEFLAGAVARAVEAGVPRAAVLVDPGLGFGKSGAQNLVLLRRLGELATLGQPIVVGASRKSFLGPLAARDGEQPAAPADRLEASLAAAVTAALSGARVIRAHDVRATARALRVADAIRAARERESGEPA